MIARSLSVLVALLATAAFIPFAIASSATALPVLRLPRHPGWHVISTGSNPKPPSAAEVTAATIPLRHDPDGANTLPPNWALKRLPDRGIILQAGNYGHGHLKNHPRRRPPLTILHSRLHHGFEGVPRRYAYVEIPATVNGWEIEVYVWFGQAHPPKTQLVKADREVRRLIFPR